MHCWQTLSLITVHFLENNLTIHEHFSPQIQYIENFLTEIQVPKKKCEITSKGCLFQHYF